MPKDKFSGFSPSPDGPATSVIDIVPDDTTDLSDISIALNAETPGSVRVTTLDGSVTDIFIAAGIAFPLRVSRVWATGTTATGLRALI